MEPRDFLTATPRAVLASITTWGGALPSFPEWRRVGRGLGLLRTETRDLDGRYVPFNDKPTIPIETFEAFKADLNAGKSWSAALARVQAKDPAAMWKIAQVFSVGDTSSGKADLADIAPPWIFTTFDRRAWWHPATQNKIDRWWVALSYRHPSKSLLAAVKQIEADARAALQGSAEPADVAARRKTLASYGQPITLEAARYDFARARGLSDAEAQSLRKPGTMTDRYAPLQLVPRSALLSSLAALRGAEPVSGVTTLRIASIRDRYPALATTTQTQTATREGVAPAGAMVEEPSTYPTASVAAGGIAGALVGGIIGRMVIGSWTGAAIGAGVAGIAGAGAGYALGSP